MEELGFLVTVYIKHVYNKVILKNPSHWYIQKLKRLMVLHYEAEHFGQRNASYINAACEQIFKRQGRLIKDLVEKGILE
jgi:hypothetical protein